MNTFRLLVLSTDFSSHIPDFFFIVSVSDLGTPLLHTFPTFSSRDEVSRFISAVNSSGMYALVAQLGMTDGKSMVCAPYGEIIPEL